MIDQVEVYCRRTEFKEHQKQILSRNLCGLFLPVSFINMGLSVIAVYRAEGFCPLDHYPVSDAGRALDIVICLIRKMIRAEEQYLFVGDYRISPDLIYVEGPYTDMPVLDTAMIWKQGDGPEETARGFQEVLYSMRERCADGGEYLERAARIASCRHLGLRAMKNRFCRLREEILDDLYV